MQNIKFKFFTDKISVYANKPEATHSHDCFEIVYIIKGRGILSMHDKDHALHPGCIYLAYPKTPHSQTHLDDGSVAVLGFKCENFPQALYEGVYHFPQHKVIYQMLKLIIEEGINQEMNHSKIMSCILQEILLLMERFISSSTNSTKSLYYIYNYISEHYDQDMKQEQLSKLSGYSTHHFRHMFTKQYGISPKQLQIKIRLEKSAELLRYSSMSCSEISESCGFSNNAQFSKMFFTKFGCSPKEFRSRLSAESR